MKKHSLIYACVALLTLFSCQEDQVLEEKSTPDLPTYKANFADIASGLAVVVKDSAVKTFIKEYALKRFSGDYDVLVQDLLPVKTTSGQSVAELLANDSTDVLTAINKQPLLTLFVPSLPDFSAETWDVESDPDPLVVYTVDEKTVAYFQNDGSTFTEALELIPTFPVIALKLNENLKVVSTTPSARKSAPGYATGNFAYEFLADPAIVKSTTSNKKNLRLANPDELDERVKTAYSYSISDCSTCYQKDYIYYGIAPSQGVNQGTLNLNYAEAITSIEPETVAALEEVTNDWTEGNLEFHVNIRFIGGSDELTSTYKKIFLSPSALYEVTYGYTCSSFCYRYATGKKPKKVVFDKPIEIVPWDMQVYGDRWVIELVEVDPSTQVKETVYMETTKGTNFKLDIGADNVLKIFKIGAGFGTESKTTKRSSKEVTYTTESDRLGEIIYTWYSPVIEKGGFINVSEGYIMDLQFKYTMKTFSTGSFRLGLETVRTSSSPS